MTPQQAAESLKRKIAEIERFRGEDLHEIIKNEAVNHFSQSFKNQGKTDKSLEKWPDVKRRDPNSEWYGFEYESNTPKPGPRKNKKSKAKYTNFSPAATTKGILIGSSADLSVSISAKKAPGKTTIFSDKPYAAVHNFGGTAKVFGKASFQMKPRPFIYRSEVLNKAIHDKVERELKRRGLLK